MKTQQFKTNAKCGACVARIGEELGKICPPDAWSIDLASPARVLTVHGDLAPADIIGTVEQAGFRAEPLAQAGDAPR